MSQQLLSSTNSDVSSGERQFQFNPESTKPIYDELKKHQVTEESWDLRPTLEWLQQWSERFVSEFALMITQVSLCVECLPAHRLGHFRSGLNGFGLAAEVAINRTHLDKREPWQVLGTLLHELLHAWQELHGKPGSWNYHNNEFREKARTLGLIIDTKGHTQYAPNSSFFAVLNKYGVETPEFPPVQYVLRGQSKQKKWSCQCEPKINVRVAVAHFYARCLWCGCVFKQQD